MIIHVSSELFVLKKFVRLSTQCVNYFINYFTVFGQRSHYIYRQMAAAAQSQPPNDHLFELRLNPMRNMNAQ